MDRSDERKDRVGDVLGLGSTAAQSPEPASKPSPEAERARRRERTQRGADAVAQGHVGPDRRPGATGIDMGAGGEGTDIEEE
ncbi:MAG TPA: hypothetical protein VH458_05125 [Vicinamibacterales bacterium]